MERGCFGVSMKKVTAGNGGTCGREWVGTFKLPVKTLIERGVEPFVSDCSCPGLSAGYRGEKLPLLRSNGRPSATKEARHLTKTIWVNQGSEPPEVGGSSSTRGVVAALRESPRRVLGVQKGKPQP